MLVNNPMKMLLINPNSVLYHGFSLNTYGFQ